MTWEVFRERIAKGGCLPVNISSVPCPGTGRFFIVNTRVVLVICSPWVEWAYQHAILLRAENKSYNLDNGKYIVRG